MCLCNYFQCIHLSSRLASVGLLHTITVTINIYLILFPSFFSLLVQHKIYKHSRFLLPSTLIWLYQCLICLILANGKKVVLVLIIVFFSFHLTTMFNFYTASVIIQNLFISFPDYKTLFTACPASLIP